MNVLATKSHLNVLKLTLNALYLYVFTFVEQSSTPSSMNESMEEEEAIPATREKEDTPKLPLEVKKVYGDGRCLFRSVAVACDNVLLYYVRNEDGWPTGVDLAKLETEKADQLRKRTIQMWKANKEVYESHALDLGLAHFWDDGYLDISERIADVEKSGTYAGEPEILALVHVIKRLTAVHYPSTGKSTLFGEAYQKSADTVHLLSYSDRGRNSLGHYDLLFYEGEEDKSTELLKVGSYVIIRKGETVWYPGLVMNADNDGNEIEVKFMYPSRNKCNKFNLGNADPMWCLVENVVLVCESPVCHQKELYSF